jgi:hypothetical protein
MKKVTEEGYQGPQSREGFAAATNVSETMHDEHRQ